MAAKKRENAFDLPKLDEYFTTQEQRDDAKLKKIHEIPLEEIDEFPDHPFKVLDDEDMMNLAESIREQGIITPATLRKKEDGRYEILSGHRRKRACELAGLETLRSEVVEMDRDAAVIFMVDSNLQRTTILPSEKAFSYKMRLEAMKRQGKSPSDMEHIKLALQGYNFGSGYITWALEKHGGYSKANAVEFSQLQTKKIGMSAYGDPDYVEHVLRYYPFGNPSYGIVNTGPGKLGLPIQNMKKSNISSPFGHRKSPGDIGSKYHKGIDIAFPTGTHVLACEAGKVEVAGWSKGFGKCIIISHGGGVKTTYAHLSKINVTKGQRVVRGQFIGEVGSTGNSTGPHLHLGVSVNGSYVDPQNGWISVP